MPHSGVDTGGWESRAHVSLVPHVGRKGESAESRGLGAMPGLSPR